MTYKNNSLIVGVDFITKDFADSAMYFATARIGPYILLVFCLIIHFKSILAESASIAEIRATLFEVF